MWFDFTRIRTANVRPCAFRTHRSCAGCRNHRLPARFPIGLLDSFPARPVGKAKLLFHMRPLAARSNQFNHLLPNIRAHIPKLLLPLTHHHMKMKCALKRVDSSGTCTETSQYCTNTRPAHPEKERKSKNTTCGGIFLWKWDRLPPVHSSDVPDLRLCSTNHERRGLHPVSLYLYDLSIGYDTGLI